MEHTDWRVNNIGEPTEWTVGTHRISGIRHMSYRQLMKKEADGLIGKDDHDKAQCCGAPYPPLITAPTPGCPI